MILHGDMQEKFDLIVQRKCTDLSFRRERTSIKDAHRAKYWKMFVRCSRMGTKSTQVQQQTGLNGYQVYSGALAGRIEWVTSSTSWWRLVARGQGGTKTKISASGPRPGSSGPLLETDWEKTSIQSVVSFKPSLTETKGNKGVPCGVIDCCCDTITRIQFDIWWLP